MATITDITKRPVSGNAAIDALIDDSQPWNFIGRNTVYYTFAVNGDLGPDAASHFSVATVAGFNGTQQANTRTALNYLSQVTGIKFAETGDANAADLHFANADLSQQYTGKAINSYKYTYQGAQVTSLNVDSWIYLDNVDDAWDNQVMSPGGVAYETMLHELGHAFGLKHPFEKHETLPAGTGAGQDNTNTTLMSYTQAGGNHTTYSPLDLEALKWLYGGDGLAGQYGVGAAAPSPVPAPAPAPAPMPAPAPAPSASPAPAPSAGPGGTGSNQSGGGSSANDTLTATAANDVLDGGLGLDTVVYAAGRAGFSIARTATGYKVTDPSGANGVDALSNIERIKFSDMSVNLTVADLAKTISTPQLDSLVELYVAYINRVPDADGMAHWIGQLKDGQSMAQISEGFFHSAVHFGHLTGYSTTTSDTDFVGMLYKNVLGRSTVDADGMAHWTGQLASGAESRASVVSSILNSAHTFKGRSDFGWVADLLDNKIAVGKEFAIHQGLVHNSSEAAITQGMAIAAAVTPTSTMPAISLIGIADGLDLMSA
ncbi:MAG TPA: DUF4214 domain-containing protein [Ramlibacter sp.]|nr:DUF4214 domain-containing protein [Ramlibacter sp.]